MNRKILRIGRLAIVALLVTMAANAGEKLDVQVTIDTVQRFASGSIGSARNSFDGTQAIGCILHASEFSVDAQCSARNAAGVVRLCNTGNPNHLAVIQAMQSDALITFMWNTDNQCTWVHVLNYSNMAPKR